MFDHIFAERTNAIKEIDGIIELRKTSIERFTKKLCTFQIP